MLNIGAEVEPRRVEDVVGQEPGFAARVERRLDKVARQNRDAGRRGGTTRGPIGRSVSIAEKPNTSPATNRSSPAFVT